MYIERELDFLIQLEQITDQLRKELNLSSLLIVKDEESTDLRVTFNNSTSENNKIINQVAEKLNIKLSSIYTKRRENPIYVGSKMPLFDNPEATITYTLKLNS